MAAQTITKVQYVDNETVIGAANLNAIQDAINDHASLIDGLDSNKVDKVAGKGLSTNDYNNDAQSKLNNLPSGAELDTSLGGKVDKRTSGTEVYTHNGSTQGGATLTETPTAGAVPQYGADGVLKAGAPVAANDVVRKAELDEVVDEMSDSTTGLNSKAPVILETVSGAIASFDDGADSMPVKKLVANIEPVQDLHGYDNPWSAGGGKNLLDYSSSHYDTTRQEFNTGITLTANQAYTFSYFGSDNVTIICYVHGTDTRLFSSGYVKSYTYTPTEDVTVDVTFYNTPSITSAENLFQLEKGSTSSTFAPYSNICPISGWTGAEVTRTGKNLFGPIVSAPWSSTVSADGKTCTSAALTRSGSVNQIRPMCNPTVKFHAGDEVCISFDIKLTQGSISSCRAQLVRSGTNDAFTGAVANLPTLTSSYQRVKLNVTVSKEGTLTGLYIQTSNPSNAIIEVSNIMVTLADDSAYEEMVSQTIAVSWQSSVGTVYGGTLTVNPDRTGTLVVDRANVALTSESQISGYSSSVEYGSYGQVASNAANYNSSAMCISSILMGVSFDNRIGTNYKSIDRCYVDSSGKVTIRASNQRSITSSTELFNAFSGCEIVYKLATPITYTLTASEISAILTTLYGTNNVWADVGPVEVTAPKDTRLYVDNHITQAIANALNS